MGQYCKPLSTDYMSRGPVLLGILKTRSRVSYTIFFFFQAEDGIRYLTVTGVQTCALPISGLCANAAGDGHGAVWSPTGSGSFSVDHLLPLPGATSSSATAINDAGLVTGSSFGSAGPERAVAWITEQ